MIHNLFNLNRCKDDRRDMKHCLIFFLKILNHLIKAFFVIYIHQLRTILEIPASDGSPNSAVRIPVVPDAIKIEAIKGFTSPPIIPTIDPFPELFPDATA
jgi:hypothetical protein